MKTVWFMTSGTGDYGDEWQVHSVHSTEQGAREAQRRYEIPRTRPDGSTFFDRGDVEEWGVDAEEGKL